MKNYKTMNLKQKGFTLVEFIAVSLLIAVLTAGIYKVLAGAENDRKSGELIAQNNLFASNVIKFYAPEADYGDVANSTPVPISNTLVFPLAPDSMKTTAGNPFRTAYGTVKMSVAPVTSQPNQFTFTYSNMLSDNCTDDIPGMAQKPFKVVIGTTTAKDLSAGTNITKAALSQACTAAKTAGATYTLVLTFS
jgi:prepilin-type N-terminal cleavage/methylation domain-containing protein